MELVKLSMHHHREVWQPRGQIDSRLRQLMTIISTGISAGYACVLRSGRLWPQEREPWTVVISEECGDRLRRGISKSIYVPLYPALWEAVLVNRYSTNHMGRSIRRDGTDYVCSDPSRQHYTHFIFYSWATVGYICETGPNAGRIHCDKNSLRV